VIIMVNEDDEPEIESVDEDRGISRGKGGVEV